MFTSTALPGNVDFLSAVNTSDSVFEISINGVTGNVFNSLTVTAAVPEPATLTLTALGVAGALARYRRRQSTPQTFQKHAAP